MPGRGGRGGRGGGRGGRGGSSSSTAPASSSSRFTPFGGTGNVLGGGGDDNYYSRGFGGSSQGRGDSKSQSVGFDYTSLHNTGRGKLRMAAGLGAGERASTHPSGSSSVSGSNTPRDSPRPHHRAPPTGPSSTTIERSPFQKGRYVKEPDYPAFRTGRGNGTGGPLRPSELTGDSQYLAGMGNGSSRGGHRQIFRSGDPALRNTRFVPVDFVKATGEWKDGAWTGKVEVTMPIEREDNDQNEGSQKNFDTLNDRPSGAGLGFSKAAHSNPSGGSEHSKTGVLPEEGYDQIAALLQAFPGSVEVVDEEDSTLPISHFQPEAYAVPDAGGTSYRDRSNVVLTDTHATMSTASASSDDDEDEEMILIPQAAGTKSYATVANVASQSDSEEERQLDAIIAASRTDDKNVESSSLVRESGDPFVFDFTGDEVTEESQVGTTASLVTSAPFVLGEQLSPQAASTLGVDELDEETIGARQTAHPYANIMTETSEEEFVTLPTDDRPHDQSSQKLTGRKKRLAAKKARRKAKKLGANQASQGQGEDRGLPIKVERSEPRMDDSDIEWGSDGPPGGQDAIDSADFSLKELSLTAAQHAPRTRAEEEKMLREALKASMSTDVTGRGRPGTSGVSHSSLLIRNLPGGLSQGTMMIEHQQGEKEHNTDLPSMAADGEEEDDDDGGHAVEEEDMDALLRFMRGMDSNGAGRQMTLGDIEDEQKMREEEEWMTESEGGEDDDNEQVTKAARIEEEGEDEEEEEEEEEGEESDDDDESEDDLILALAEQEEIGESDGDDSSIDDAEEFDDDDDDEDGSDDSDEEEDRIFDRNFSWAAEDEAFINKLEQFAQDNHHILTGSDRKARNRLYKAIENGDFGEDLDEDELIGLSPAKKVKGNKKWKSDDIWAEELQKQWEKDRATKADNKRKRAEERRAAARTPYLNTHKKGTKKMAKKAARAARRAGRTVDDPAAWDEEVDLSSTGVLSHKAGNLGELDAQIHQFLDDAGHTTLSLPPMDKRARAQVHMLASAYSLVSKSRGSGRARFTTLIKNSRSGVHVDTRKVRSILSGRGEASFGSGLSKKGKGKSSSGGGGGGGGGLGRMGGSAPSNIDGAAVGWGADRIGADNVGHRLLSMMGWAEGMGVGASGGMADPIGATIKTSKGGLGF